MMIVVVPSTPLLSVALLKLSRFPWTFRLIRNDFDSAGLVLKFE